MAKVLGNLLGLSRNSSDKSDAREKCWRRTQELEAWREDEKQLAAVVAHLAESFAEHKWDFIAFRHRSLKAMIRTAIGDCQRVERRRLERDETTDMDEYRGGRMKSNHEELNAEKNTPAMVPICEQFRENASRLVARREIDALSKGELEDRLNKVDTELIHVHADYLRHVDKLKNLETQFNAAKQQLTWRIRRYLQYKRIIKAAIRHGRLDTEKD